MDSAGRVERSSQALVVVSIGRQFEEVERVVIWCGSEVERYEIRERKNKRGIEREGGRLIFGLCRVWKRLRMYRISLYSVLCPPYYRTRYG